MDCVVHGGGKEWDVTERLSLSGVKICVESRQVNKQGTMILDI